MMKKYIVNIFIFLFIVAIIDFFVGLAGDYLQSHAKSGDTRKTNDLIMSNHHDIIVFGSSRACHHYDTPFLSDTLGLDIYNAGYDGNSIVLAYGLMAMVFERYHPKLIIYDVEPTFDINVYAADNGHKRYISLLKPYYLHAGAKEVIEAVSEEEFYKSYSGMIRYNTTIISKGLDFFKEELSCLHGYEPIYGSYTGELTNKTQSVTDEGFVMQPQNGAPSLHTDYFKLMFFEKMLILSQSKNIPLLVVASPKLGMKNSAELEPVIDLCQKYKVPFIDYYADIEFMQHKEWFKEPMHLNNIGARLFSSKIVDSIRRTVSYNS